MSAPFPDPSVSIRHDLRSGDIGYITYLHAILYADQGWDYTFDAYVAIPLAEFARSQSQSQMQSQMQSQLQSDTPARSRIRSPRERIWILENKDRIVGSLAIVEHNENEAQLRWFLLTPKLRGRGTGRWLVESALEFCRSCGYRSVFLWTVNTLPIAAELYRSVGFEPKEELTHEIWGRSVTEVRYELQLSV